jgi:hypothetical protein
LYGCKTWSLTLGIECRRKVFGKRMLRRIFGPKRDEIIGGWRKLHYEKLHNFPSSPNIIRKMKSRRMKWAEHVANIGGNKNAYRSRRKETTGKI